ncbi:cyanoexosortase A system-associated protein [Synechococcales cyanobacterium C]|uniref:Cyanoexosortase A system-associated protein n=1 Tax=Petrachloros mirabilis ULC683 TaxID=2781853 RepID=A0A8K2A613_9CYAN|nr:cyanoexosortase A system-associated protein [Petrachloros mirabilis ULC683]
MLVRSVIKSFTVPQTVFSFPDQVSLAGATLRDSQPTDRSSQNSYVERFDSRFYGYIFQDKPLEVEILYVEGTGGSLEQFYENFEAFKQMSIPLKSEVRQRPGRGFYQLYTDQSYAYLSACIAPTGRSTVTFNQFIQGWRNHLYLLGRDYVDNRCLWTHLRRPLDAQSPAEAYEDLEAFWSDWQVFWRRRFPKLDSLKVS